MRTRTGLAIAAIALAIAACGPSVKVQRLGDWKGGSHGRTVDVFRNESEVGRPYREVAILTADDNSLDLRHKLKDAIKTKAAEIGADAVIILDEEQIKKRGPQFRMTLIVPPAERNIMHASAIVYER